MGDEVVRRIKDAVDIVELVGDVVRLEKRGKNFFGLCPFHDEKTPSFMVSPDRGTWHCFGCGKGGDAFSFVMEREGMTFPEALDLLGRRTGIEVPRRGGHPHSADLYDVMEEAVAFYRRELRSDGGVVGQAYLKRRNITPEDAARFQLGWSPASWRELSHGLKNLGISDSQMLKCGLVIQSERGCYDRFRGRLIFPIRNVSGRAIALGGRIVDGEGAKYLNSPEGPLYNKKDNLYLLDQAKNSIREKKRSILVEGYMDAIRLHLHGYTETVASLGTALTETQAKLLKRFSDHCYICYDSDKAGQNATLRGMYVLEAAGLSVFVVEFPGGKDPDELLQTEGGEALFDEAVKKAKPLVLYHLSLYKREAEEIGEVKATEELISGLARLSAIELSPYIREIAYAVGLPDYELLPALEHARRRSSFGNGYEAFDADVEDAPFDAYGESTVAPGAPATEAGLLYLLWSVPTLCRSTGIRSALSYITDERVQMIAASLISGELPERMESQWLQLGDKFPMRTIAAGGAFCDTLPGDVNEKYASIITDLTRSFKQQRYIELREKMFRGEADAGEMQEYSELACQLKS